MDLPQNNFITALILIWNTMIDLDVYLLHSSDFKQD